MPKHENIDAQDTLKRIATAKILARAVDQGLEPIKIQRSEIDADGRHYHTPPKNSADHHLVRFDMVTVFARFYYLVGLCDKCKIMYYADCEKK